MSDSERATGLVIGLLVGTAIGMAIGFLYAPRPGRETRTLIREKATGAKEKAEEIIEEAKERAKKIIADARGKAADISKEGEISTS